MRDFSYYVRHIRSLVPGRLKALSLRIFLGAAIGLALASPAVPAQAAADLDISPVTSWTIGGIMPGDSGTETVTLSNIGDVNGQVFIWVTNIVSDEGAQPESETGDTSNPGELLENLLFSISSPSSAFSTSPGLIMPTTLDNFPSIGDSTPYITINPLIAGGAGVTITWHWELPLATGNEAQGDFITFDINYGIIDLPPPPTTTFAGTTRTCECQINVLNEIYEVRIDCCNNTVNGTRIYLDPDEIHFLEIERGTALICGDCWECGNYPRWIVMSPLAAPPPPPEGLIQIGPAYKLIGYSDEDMEDECTSVIFGKPVILLLNYDPGELPGDTSAVIIAYFDEELGEWVELQGDTGTTGRVAGVGDVTGVLNHLSTFGVFAKQGPPAAPEEPSPPPSTITPPSPLSPAAHFVLSDLNIVSDRQLTALGRFFTFVLRGGESVTVTADVVNDGGQEGSYTAGLEIDGSTVAAKDIALLPGQTQELIFTILDNEPGLHTVQVGELHGQFSTSVWVNWWLIAGIATAFGFLVWLAWYYVYRRRKLS